MPQITAPTGLSTGPGAQSPTSAASPPTNSLPVSPQALPEASNKGWAGRAWGWVSGKKDWVCDQAAGLAKAAASRVIVSDYADAVLDGFVYDTLRPSLTKNLEYFKKLTGGDELNSVIDSLAERHVTAPLYEALEEKLPPMYLQNH